MDRFFNAEPGPMIRILSTCRPPARRISISNMRGSLEGIGALLREEDGYIKVVRIIPGSAAERQGQLQAEDVILAGRKKTLNPGYH